MNFFNIFVRKPKKAEAAEVQNEEKLSFSKTLLVQESLLIWIHTISMIVLAYICVFKGYYAELPWLTAMVALPWTAYAVRQHAYYRKAQAENTEGGIVFEQAKWDIEAVG